MWRRTYFLLLLVRLFFALSPSYLHPDEAFQGPEVIIGNLFGYPSTRTWEWTVSQPIRSVFPLWLFYGLPLTLLNWLWAKEVHLDITPGLVYFSLRAVMFMLSFVLEDWAVHDLVQSPKLRQQAVVLVASSYVTWTFQTHTFSNSIETVLVLWSLLLLDRIAHERKRSAIGASFVLGFVLVLGTFSRITFPTFILIPGMRLLPRLLNRPVPLVALCVSGFLFTYIAVATDTAFYSGPAATESFLSLFNYMRLAPVMTPLNNIRYNSQQSNLAEHGLHPHYQHLLLNLPQLLGPALPLLIVTVWSSTGASFRAIFQNSRLTAAATGCLMLSLIPHQEPRFLLPCIPLLLTCVKIPTSTTWSRLFWISWIVFNSAMAVLMGIYHQGGVVPTQLALPDIVKTQTTTSGSAEVFWWKTYPPPTYLVGHQPANSSTGKPVHIKTTTLMGLPQSKLLSTLGEAVDLHTPSCDPSVFEDFFSFFAKQYTEVYLAAPFSAWRLENILPTENFTFSMKSAQPLDLHFKHLHSAWQHINLDDMDFGDDGISPTLSRVVGRRGLGVWRVERDCTAKGKSGIHGEDTTTSEPTTAAIVISQNSTVESAHDQATNSTNQETYSSTSTLTPSDSGSTSVKFDSSHGSPSPPEDATTAHAPKVDTRTAAEEETSETIGVSSTSGEAAVPEENEEGEDDATETTAHAASVAPTESEETMTTSTVSLVRAAAHVESETLRAPPATGSTADAESVPLSEWEHDEI